MVLEHLLRLGMSGDGAWVRMSQPLAKPSEIAQLEREQVNARRIRCMSHADEAGPAARPAWPCGKAMMR